MKKVWQSLAFTMGLLLCTLCSGCLQGNSLDEYGYGQILGVDVGEETPYYVTFLVQNSVAGGQTDAPGGNSILMGAACSSLSEAVDIFNGSLPFRLDTTRTAVIVIGEDLANTAERLQAFLSAPIAALQIREQVNLIAAKGSARDYVAGLRSSLAPNLAKLQDAFVQYSRSTGLVPVITLTEFHEGAQTEAFDAVLPLGTFDPQRMRQEDVIKLPEEDAGSLNEYLKQQELTADAPIGGMASGLRGAAVFDGMRFAGFLSGADTQMLLMATGRFERGTVQLTDPFGGTVSLRITAAEAPRMTLSSADSIKAHFHIRLQGTLLQPGGLERLSHEEQKAYLEAALAQRMQQVFLACRRMGSDAFGLGRSLKRQMRTQQEWETFSLKDTYSDASAVFQVRLSLRYAQTSAIEEQSK